MTALEFHLAVIKGDGIGPEVIDEATKVLDAVGKKFGHTFHYNYLLAGGCAIDATGVALPEETLSACKQSDSVLLGAVGGPKWDNLESGVRPEQALLGLRGELELYANLRPAVLYAPLKEACPLKERISSKGIDICVVRELTGGIYFGDRGTEGDNAYDTERYSAEEIRRIAVRAFAIAMKRKKKVTCVDKANILDTSRLWRRVVREVAAEYPEVALDFMYIDNAAMQVVRDPSQFDVIVTSNMFGDILSDEASMVTGSIGMLPSASLGKTKRGMYEPIHGSAPDIAGKSIANPLATILSAAMMLRYSFDLDTEAKCIEDAVLSVLAAGHRTVDIADGGKAVSTMEMGDLVAAAL